MSKIITGADYGVDMRGSTPKGQDRFWDVNRLAVALYPWTDRNGVVYFEDDFTGDTLNSDFWTASKDTGPTDFTPAASAANGVCLGVTGTTADRFLAMNYNKVDWYGENYAGMDVIVKVSAVTELTAEIGFTDALSDETVQAVSDVDTPATGNGAAEVAVFHMDTDQTLTNFAFVTDNDTTVQSADLGFTPTADTYYIFRVQLFGTSAFCKVMDMNYNIVPGTEKHINNAIQGDVAVRPHIFFGTNDTTSKNISVDLVRVWQDRVAH